MKAATTDSLDILPADAVIEAMKKCCGSAAWCRGMLALHPFRSNDRLHVCADQVFDSLSESDWREAFACHPEIGDLESLKMKFAGNASWSAGEQSGLSKASDETIGSLAAGNQEYRKRFGYIFIVCASGKSADQMLEILHQRLNNDAATELRIAASEQRRITHLRLDKLVASRSPSSNAKAEE